VTWRGKTRFVTSPQTSRAPEAPVGLAGAGEPGEQGSESVGTVLLAGAANLTIAVSKLVAGLISGSSAMLSEAAHSIADTITEVFLYVALVRGRKPADEDHPFGYGKESFVWAFIAALFTFVGGAGFSVYHGIAAIVEDEPSGDFRWSYIVLAVSFVAEGVSFLKAQRQVAGESRRWGVTRSHFLRLTPDTTVKAVYFEDSAALVGLVLAALGLALTQLTGDELWDGVASIAIGVLLFGVAAVLARSNASLLVGRAVPRRVHNDIARELAGLAVVEAVPTLLTMQLGPSDIMVAAKVDFTAEATSDEIEASSDDAERRLRERYPAIRYVFLDPTRGTAGRHHLDGGVE
jgi:cation diffusion facilitator family transporter